MLTGLVQLTAGRAQRAVAGRDRWVTLIVRDTSFLQFTGIRFCCTSCTEGGNPLWQINKITFPPQPMRFRRESWTVTPEVGMSEVAASESSWLSKAARHHLPMKCPLPSTALGPLLAEATVLPVRPQLDVRLIPHWWPSAPAPPQKPSKTEAHFSPSKRDSARDGHRPGYRRVGSVHNRRLVCWTPADAVHIVYGKLIPSNGAGAVQCFLFEVAKKSRRRLVSDTIVQKNKLNLERVQGHITISSVCVHKKKKKILPWYSTAPSFLFST